jgi:hypothetical protein
VSCCRWCKVRCLCAITEVKGSKDGVCNERTGGCGSDCEAEYEPHGTATQLGCALSAVMKSLSKKCLLQKEIIVQHSSRISCAGYSNFASPKHSPVRVE